MNLISKIIVLAGALLLLLGACALLFLPSFPPLLFILYALAIIVISTIALLLSSLVVKHINPEKITIKAAPDQDISLKTNPVIFSVRSVFPLELFPDKYILQEKTMSVIKKKFFFSSEIETVQIKDILSSRLYTGPVLVSLTLVRKMPGFPEIQLTNLWKSDGLKFKQYLDALIMKENKLVKVPNDLSLKSKKKLIYEIGREKEVEIEV